MDLASHWRGHFLLFEGRSAPAYDAAAGWRILLIVVLLEAVIGPRWHVVDWLGIVQPPATVRVVLSLAAVLVLVRYFAQVPWRDIGFIRWRDWSPTEKSYFIQVLVLANVLFALLLAARIGTLPAATLAIAIATNFLWGFHQEVVYRGLLQTELVRRLGPLAGIAIATVLFTVGPLHFYYFSGPTLSTMPVGIFAIGLFFALLFHRSRNLWLPAVFHGIGTAWILTSLGHGFRGG